MGFSLDASGGVQDALKTSVPDPSRPHPIAGEIRVIRSHFFRSQKIARSELSIARICVVMRLRSHFNVLHL